MLLKGVSLYLLVLTPVYPFRYKDNPDLLNQENHSVHGY